MNPIRIETIFTGETFHLPQFKPFVGKSVEIVVRESPLPSTTPGTSTWREIQAAVQSLEDYDFDAWKEARIAEVKEQVQKTP